ncbi:hypothetical protein GBAR_LOCUS22624, partial [Geodia barretti]
RCSFTDPLKCFALYECRYIYLYSALRCSCNDESVLSDCRWEEWTCTIDTSHSACYTRRTRREDGYIKQDEGCVNTAWNPTFCGRASETQAVLCCNDSDMCNQYFTPTFLPRAIVTSTKAPQSISNIHTFSLVRDTVTLRVSSTILELSTSHALSTLLSTTTEGTFSVSSAPTKTPSPTSQPGFYSAIEPVIGGICCSCVFVSGSSAIGCSLKLYSDEHTLLVFNISRGTYDNVAVLKCFTMQQTGVFGAFLHEIQEDGSEGPSMLHLQDVKLEIRPICGNTKTESASKSRVMTGLSVALSLALVILLLTTLITCFLLVTNQRARHKRNSTITQSDLQAVSPSCLANC